MRMMTATCALMMMAMPVMALAQDTNTQMVSKNDVTTFDITAQADIKAEPDIAMVSAGVLTVAKTADAAMKENAVRMNAIFKSLKAAGIADKDQQTSGININPQYVYEDNKSPKITGYQASNTVNVTIRDLKKIGPALDALIAQGANQLNGPTFTLDNPEDLLNQARKDAVEKARKRAELYATATGLKIKKIRNLSENANMGGPVPYPAMARKMMMASADAAESTPVAAGQVNLNVTVNITYELE